MRRVSPSSLPCFAERKLVSGREGLRIRAWGREERKEGKETQREAPPLHCWVALEGGSFYCTPSSSSSSVLKVEEGAKVAAEEEKTE